MYFIDVYLQRKIMDTDRGFSRLMWEDNTVIVTTKFMHFIDSIKNKTHD